MRGDELLMYVCNCNGISERDVKSAVRAGAARWDDVHAYYGCTPACGKCECEIVDAIAEHRGKRRADPRPFFAPSAIAAAT